MGLEFKWHENTVELLSAASPAPVEVNEEDKTICRIEVRYGPSLGLEAAARLLRFSSVGALRAWSRSGLAGLNLKAGRTVPTRLLVAVLLSQAAETKKGASM